MFQVLPRLWAAQTTQLETARKPSEAPGAFPAPATVWEWTFRQAAAQWSFGLSGNGMGLSDLSVVNILGPLPQPLFPATTASVMH